MNYLQAELNDLLKKDTKIFEFIQKGSLDGIWYWDLEKPENEWMSDQFWETFGIAPADKQHLSSEWQDIIFQEDLELALVNFKKHCQNPNHPYDQIVRYRHSNGSTIWVRCRGIAIRDENGTPIRMLGAHNDITSLKLIEEKLIKSNTDLTLFTKAVTHDLKAPLRTMTRFLEEIKNHFHEHQDEESEELFMYAENASKQMHTLVNDLFRFTTLGDNTLNSEKILLSNLVETIKNSLKSDIDDNHVTIKLENDCQINGYKMMINQLLQNLIANSIKYTKPGVAPEININCKEHDQEWTISVEDNGIGIDSNYHSSIFNPFTRLHTWSEYEGSGLGLSLCLKAVDFHRGKIWVESEVNKGSKFCFTLKKPMFR